MMVSAAIGFVVACLVSLILTPLVRKAALKTGLVDRPDSRRKLHGKPMPLGGGIVVFLGMSIVLGGVLVMPNPWGIRFSQDWHDVLAFFISGGLIVALGLVDDRFGLRGRQKLLGQIVAASALAASGLVIRGLGIFGFYLDLGWFAFPVTVIWLVGAINAINLLDGIDGLATTIGIILSITLAILATMTHHPGVAVIALVLAGSLLGFLRYNFPPAKIFLGDAGSMLIGLMVGRLAIRASLKGPGTVLLAAPLAIWTIPVIDSAAAILRRKLSSRSIYTTDRGHLHHRLLDRLGTRVRVLALITACCALTSVCALLSVYLKHDLIAVVSFFAIVAVFVITGLFGRGEFLLLFHRMRSIILSFGQTAGTRKGKARESAVHLQGSRPWGLLWTTLTESAEKLHLRKIDLDLNLPASHEGYNATWEQPSTEGFEKCWRFDLPLVIAEQPLGRLMIVGQLNGTSACEDIEQLLDLVDACETRMSSLLSDAAPGLAPQAVTISHGGNGESVPASAGKPPR